MGARPFKGKSEGNKNGSEKGLEERPKVKILKKQVSLLPVESHSESLMNLGESSAPNLRKAQGAG